MPSSSEIPARMGSWTIRIKGWIFGNSYPSAELFPRTLICLESHVGFFFDCVVPHKLLIPAQPQFTICAALSGVFSARAGASGTEDFGTAGNAWDLTSGLPRCSLERNLSDRRRQTSQRTTSREWQRFTCPVCALFLDFRTIRMQSEWIPMLTNSTHCHGLPLLQIP